MHSVKVWSDFACFTRPEFGVERVSYPVMTPSAARGVLEAIFWKPEFNWKVREIWILEPIRHFSILRNEVTKKQSKTLRHYYADDDRTQRHTLGLRNVAYIIKADIQLKPHATEDIAKYNDQFRRRVQKGQCHHQPYLGTREFSAFFAPATPEDEAQKINYSDHLGLMLLDIDFIPNQGKSTISFMNHDDHGAKVVAGKAKPKFFNARVIDGVLRIN
jgi:CRISPR-associated protein Cas5d